MWQIVCMILAVSVILGWTFWGLSVLELDAPFADWFRESENRLSGLNFIFAILLFTIGIYGLENPQNKFLQGIAGELIGMSITILLLDQFNNWRQHYQRKKEILEQIGSYSNEFALEAVRLASKYKWLIDGSLDETDLTGTNLSKADLSGASLRSTRLRSAELIGTDLGGANLSQVDLFRSNLREAKLQNCQLQKACLYEAELNQADLFAANLTSADIREADLRNASLQGAILINADLRRAKLQGADLTGAYLGGADLRFIEVDEKTSFFKAVYSSTTKWHEASPPLSAQYYEGTS